MQSFEKTSRTSTTKLRLFRPKGLPDAYVLTIDEAGGRRRRSASEQLDGLPFDWSFVEGYNARQQTPWHIYSPQRNRLAMKRSLTAGEVACYAGHRKIWEQILASGDEHGLVLEDDFQFTDSAAFIAGVAAGLDHAEHWDMLKFFDFQPKRVLFEADWNGVRFTQFKYPASGMVAYVINRRGCEAMLRRDLIYRPVDEDLSYPWETSVRVWSMDPNPVTEIAWQLGGSLLESERVQRREEERRLTRRVYGKWLVLQKKTNALRYFLARQRKSGPWRKVSRSLAKEEARLQQEELRLAQPKVVCETTVQRRAA